MRPVRLMQLCAWVVLSVVMMGASLRLPRVPAPGVSLGLAWDSVDVAAGYKVYWGSESRGYTNLVFTCTNEVSITNLQFGTTYFFAATSIEADGLESGFSDEAVYTTETITSPPAVTGFLVGVRFQESTNLVQWADCTNASVLVLNDGRNRAFRVVGPVTIQPLTASATNN